MLSCCSLVHFLGRSFWSEYTNDVVHANANGNTLACSAACVSKFILQVLLAMLCLFTLAAPLPLKIAQDQSESLRIALLHANELILQVLLAMLCLFIITAPLPLKIVPDQSESLRIVLVHANELILQVLLAMLCLFILTNS